MGPWRKISKRNTDANASRRLAYTRPDDPPPDPHNREAFETWLRSKPRNWSLVIAARAALRVLPVVRWGKLHEAEVTAVVFPIYRAIAIARFAAFSPNCEFDTAAKAAHDAVDGARVGHAGYSADGARAAAYAAYTADAAAAAALAAYSAANAEAGVSEVGLFTAGSELVAAEAARFTFVAAAVRKDALKLKSGMPPTRLAHEPLWEPDDDLVFPTAYHSRRWIGLQGDLRRVGRHWQVWIDWYEEVLAGSPPSPPRNEEWDAAFTDVPGPLPWDDGPKAVNLAIKARLDALQAAESSSEVPEQSPAPIRVEVRDGRIARVRNDDSPLRTAERDFDAWREPIIDHIEELTSGDFREGTNHSRAHDRLVALGNLLLGDIDEVKDRQFRIGYEIERLEGLITAYRSGGDDMPELNAASLEDLDKLRIALRMGIDKLERWAEFRRMAADDPRREGDARQDAVGEALDEMAADMERAPKYFDPELPASFRFLSEAVKDRIGATKTIVYGAVKSAENVISFLGQLALGICRKTAGAVEQHIPKAVAASLLILLSGAALKLSGALPQGWAWLRPLLDSLTKFAGG